MVISISERTTSYVLKNSIQFLKIFVLIFFILIVTYGYSILKIDFIKKYVGCINDILAIITLGISIEDSVITGILKEYYKNKT